MSPPPLQGLPGIDGKDGTPGIPGVKVRELQGMTEGTTTSLGVAAPARGVEGTVPTLGRGATPTCGPPTAGDTPSVPCRVAQDRLDGRGRRDTGDKP